MQDNLSQELGMARRVQQGLLTFETPEVPGITIAKRCVAAETIGGDFFVIRASQAQGVSAPTAIPGVSQYMDQRQWYVDIAVGDVAGHGVSSALVMALSAGIIREILKTCKTMSQALGQVNDTLLTYIENSQIRYVTAFCIRYYPGISRLEWSSAGHPGAILLRGANVIPLNSDGIFLGMFADETFPMGEMSLKSGDRVLIYTDGLTEVRNPSGEEFGLDRLNQLAMETSGQEVNSQLESIFNTIDHFGGKKALKDDQTLVIMDVQ